MRALLSQKNGTPLLNSRPLPVTGGLANAASHIHNNNEGLAHLRNIGGSKDMMNDIQPIIEVKSQKEETSTNINKDPVTNANINRNQLSNPPDNNESALNNNNSFGNFVNVAIGSQGQIPSIVTTNQTALQAQNAPIAPPAIAAINLNSNNTSSSNIK